ncbi:MAG: HypC/HybG/HupF family hydrogenase formation chaperone [Thermoguttaceae bacterium]|jgi:hydrogenase expression/formation protein HypC
MCLGVPGKLVEIYPQADLELPKGKVEFGGIYKDICLAYTPEARVGDYVLVHVGFAISRIDQAEAEEIFSYLNEIGEIEENEEEVGEQSSGQNDEGRITNDKRIAKHE